MATLTASLAPVQALLEDYAATVKAQLEAEGRPVDRYVPTAPGVNPAWDSSCGQVYGRVVQAVPVTPDQRGLGAGCGVLFWIVTLGIAVTRCVTQPTVSGQRIALPAAARVSADGVAIIDDMITLERVVTYAERTRSVVIIQPLAEQGGLAGSEILFTVRLDALACDPITLTEG